jgi:hypothetical protein
VKRVGKGTIATHLKALKAMYRSRAVTYPGGPDAYKEEYGDEPNASGDMNGLKRAQRAETAATRRKRHHPRGKGALAREGQLFEYGTINTAMPASQNYERARSVCSHHAFSHNLVLQFDDCQKLLLSQFCCMDAPQQIGDKCGKGICAVLDWRKSDGAYMKSLQHSTIVMIP